MTLGTSGTLRSRLLAAVELGGDLDEQVSKPAAD
jgi:hypothetical protein